jgi:hypothetical protein
VQPDEICVATLPARRDQHIDDLRQLAADVVAAQRVIGNASGQRLAAGDHVKLPDEKPVEGIVVQPGRSGHGRIMRPRSVKT